MHAHTCIYKCHLFHKACLLQKSRLSGNDIDCLNLSKKKKKKTLAKGYKEAICYSQVNLQTVTRFCYLLSL